MASKLTWKGPFKFDDRAWYLDGHDDETRRTKSVAVQVIIDGRRASRALALRIKRALTQGPQGGKVDG